MPLILSNDDIAQVLDMPECIEALENAYRDHAALRAVNRPRSDVYTPHEREDAFYILKSFEGMLPSAGVAALRLNSDVIVWSDYAGRVRKDKQPLADGRWVGLVLLFSTSTGELLAVFPDGVMQRMRVGGTNGIGAKYLAREDAAVYGLLGAGWQAGGQLMAMATVRLLEDVRVYSPNPASREAFVREFGGKLGLPVRAVASAREAAEGADIIGTATSSVQALIEPEWLAPGAHVTCVKRSELGDRTLARCQQVVVHAREGAPLNYLVGVGDVAVASHDPLDLMRKVRAGQQVTEQDITATEAHLDALPGEPQLSAVVAGEAPGRTSETDINAFVNNIGLGIQFAALGALAYRKARERGLGRELPGEWFSEDVHP